MAIQSVLDRLLSPADADMPAAYARRLLQLSFTDSEQARHQELSEKAGRGVLSVTERAELEDLQLANDVLVVLKSKAELSLQTSMAASEVRAS